MATASPLRYYLVELLVLLSLIASARSPLMPTPDSTGVSSVATSPPPTFSLRSSSDGALLRWAFSRFERAGLALPPVSVAFHSDLTDCGGYYGSFRAHPFRVDVCGFNHDRFLPAPKRIALHELAHAWIYVNVDESTRRALLDLRDLEAWNDQSDPWESRGFEISAEIIAWALMDEERRPLNIPDSRPSELARAYELLTSTPRPSR